MRTIFAKTLLELAKENKDIVLLTADLGFKVFDEYRLALPKQFVNMGVAEQNMIGVAAGLALSGKKVYCYSMVPFLVMRPFEQIRVDVCNHNLNVTLVGVGGGLSYGMEGMTHHGFEDISLMRSLPGMTVTAPSDPIECEAITRESVEYKGPLFIRLGKNNDPILHNDKVKIRIGKGVVIGDNGEICLIATGSMLPVAKLVSKELAGNGLSPTLISMHTIKPLDVVLVARMAISHRAIFTIEEHSIIGGLGSAVAEYMMEEGHRCMFKKIGLPDKYCSHIGDHNFLKDKCGLTVENIKQQILAVLNKGEG